MQYTTLRNGLSLPLVGFGTYKQSGQVCYQSVRTALDVGYVHIDTAAYYENESEVGRAIRDSKINRESLFVTSKIWNSEQGTEKATASIERSLQNLDLGYIDLMLIHWPIPVGREHDYQELNKQTLEVMALYRQKGLIKHLGVSNFLPEHLEALERNTGIRPLFNQIEMHPGLPQTETVTYCKDKGIAVEAWRPLMNGACDRYPVLQQAAQTVGKTPSQVALRWLVQQNVLVLPRSQTPSRIKENFELFDFSLDEETMQLITNMEEVRCGSHPLRLTRT